MLAQGLRGFLLHFFKALGCSETGWCFVFYDATFGEQSSLIIPRNFLIKRFPQAKRNSYSDAVGWEGSKYRCVFTALAHVSAKRLRLNLGKGQP